MPSVSVNAHSFYYEEMGQAGEPLVFLSGLGGDHRAFSLTQRYFSRHFRTLAFDARDVGRSDRVGASYSTADMADDVAAWLDAVDAAGAHVVGQSLGGLVAQQLAIRHPQLIKSLILASSHAGSNEWRRAVIESWVLLRREVAIGVFTRATLPWLVAPAFYHQASQIEGLVSSPNATPGRKTRRHSPVRPARRPSTTPVPPSAASASLAWCSSASWTWSTPLASPASSPTGWRRRMVVIPGVGHMPHIEDKLRFRLEIEAFLDGSLAAEGNVVR